MFGPEPFKGVFYKSSPFQKNFPKPILKIYLHLKGLLIDAFVAKVCGEVPHFHHLWPLPCTEERRFHSRVTFLKVIDQFAPKSTKAHKVAKPNRGLDQ
jgi:hypothetical protein